MSESSESQDWEAGTSLGPTPDEIAALLQVEHLLDQRWPETRIEPSLTRISALMDLLGSPQLSYPSIHIAGTNGKTSVARMIDALVTALQQRTGRTTSRTCSRRSNASRSTASRSRRRGTWTCIGRSSRSCTWSTSSRRLTGGQR